MSWIAPALNVGPAVRGGDPSQPPERFAVQSATITWAWGAQPSEGAVRYVGTSLAAGPIVTPGQRVWLELYGRVFYGVCVSVEAMAGSSGQAIELRFADDRLLLDWDVVFGLWNMGESRIVAGRRQRRYWHLRPRDFTSGRHTWTTDPLSARQILDDIFGAPTVQTAWDRSYHAALNAPVYGVDAASGRKVMDLVAQLTEAVGAMVTADGAFRLRWARRGDGEAIWPPTHSDDQREGTGLSGAPTRLFVVGERNLYQVCNLDLQPDWNQAWNDLWSPDGTSRLTEWVYHYFTKPGTTTLYRDLPRQAGETDDWHAWNLALVRSLQVTVREVAERMRLFFANLDLTDPRKFAGRLRMDMPAALYLRTLVYRAFRLPEVVHGRPRAAWAITADGPADLEYDPATGTATPRADGLGAGSGLVLAQGYNVGADLFKRVRPESLDLSRLAEAQAVWAPVGFQVDDGGAEDSQFVILDEAALLIQDALTQVDGHLVFKAGALRLKVAPVRASLPLLGERFVHTVGTGVRDESFPVAGLRAEYVVHGGQAHEIPYADGRTARDKAEELAAPVLQQGFALTQGRFTIRMKPGETLNALSPTTSSLTAQWSDRGHDVVVELARERPRAAYLPEQDLDRLYRLDGLFPGQEELRAERRQAEMEGRVLQQSPELRRQLRAAYEMSVGDRGPVEVGWIEGGSGTLPVGTPLWKEPGVLTGGRLVPRTAVPPGEVSESHEEFVGVTLREAEAAELPVSVQSTGMLLVRAKGPVAVNDTLGRSAGHDYLVTQTGGPGVAVALQAVDEGETRLIRARVAGGGGGGSAAYWA